MTLASLYYEPSWVVPSNAFRRLSNFILVPHLVRHALLNFSCLRQVDYLLTIAHAYL